jgi:predicted PurR-regulated permease PerM
MAVATLATAAVSVGASVYAGNQQKKAAKNAANAISSVQYNPTAAAKKLKGNMPLAFGTTPQQFDAMQKASNDQVLAHLSGEVSDSTKTTLGRQMLGTGAVDLGPGAVNQLYGGYLGLTTEDLATQGNNQYQSLYQMYDSAVNNRAQAQYQADMNRAQGQASSIIAQGNANAAMAQGIGSAVGGAMGGLSGSFSGASRGSTATLVGSTTTASGRSLPSGTRRY